jgi:general nucleoside transport system ATP-binding protein
LNVTVQGRKEAPPFALELTGVDKRFGDNHAVRAVNLAVRRGAIHGLVGENGAGKSTLMNLAYGYLPADAGEIRVFGRLSAIHRPADAIAAGIGMVHQHFMLVDAFTAVENLLLGAEGGALLQGGAAAARAALARLGRDYGLEIAPDQPAGEMTVGARQRLEIAKALFRGAEILILDEPTAVLTPPETDSLFALLRALKGEGKTVIVITHKLKEIIAHTDRVTVMRRGRVAGDFNTSDVTADQLARLMVGGDTAVGDAAGGAPDPATIPPGEILLSALGLRVTGDDGRERVRGVDFTLRAGEIVGVAGVSGNGQSELLEALAGMRRLSGGRLHVLGREVDAQTRDYDPTAARRSGLAHAPEDRHRLGMVGAFPASEASILGYHDSPAWNGRWRLLWREVRRRCARLMSDYDVRPPDPDQPIERFSGGNQQKIIMAREIEQNPAVLLAGQPTRGVDIGAAAFIHARLRRLKAAGKAVLLVSTELDEITALADRILVMCDGRIVGETTPALADARLLGLMMAGVATHNNG